MWVIFKQCAAGDGIIQKEELEQVMKACLDENGVCFDDSDLADLAQALFEAITHCKSSGITLEAFKAQLNKQEGLMQNLSITIDRWLLLPNNTHAGKKEKANQPASDQPAQVRCLKITEKVSFNIASEASYAYILNGQK